MVPILAKQAVQIKCGFENARLTGNYELAYALGILSSLAGIDKTEHYNSMSELKESVMEKTAGFTTKNEHLAKLIELLKDYEPSDAFDGQMTELFNMGYEDKKL
ncbi:MAG: DUF3837 domain-containing protein [Eubacteriales bacterium]|nr:DUF3837 domain-containing protein [Eubacteriales bacterium]